MAPPPVSHSTPESSQPEHPQWEIATACGVLLSQRFGVGEMLEGMVVNIDEEALQTAIEALEPKDKGTLLFQVQDASSPRLRDGERVSNGVCVQLIDGDEIKISIAITRFSKEQRKEIESQGEPSTIEEYMNLPTPTSATLAETQKTSLHELRHAIDCVDKEVAILEEKHRKTIAVKEKFYRRGILAARKVLYGMYGAGIGGVPAALLPSSRIAMIGPMVLGTIGGLLYSNQNKEEGPMLADILLGDNYTYMASLPEKRARAAGNRADLYPQIISIDATPDANVTG
jgi:hypothetical protein